MNQIAREPTNNDPAGDFSPVAAQDRSVGLDLAALLPRQAAADSFASGSPEVSQVEFGILPLTDCAPIVVAHAKGMFSDYGIQSNISTYRSWTGIRDALGDGAVHAAHLLFGMPVAAAAGKLGTQQKPLIIPWILSRNGQAITLAAKHAARYLEGPQDLRSYAKESAAKGRPMVFGITLSPGTHAMWLRYWLASGGIDPDKDVALITIPPPQMVENMRAERLDGFCVGEPWNAKAVEAKLGFTAALTEQIWPDHPEKVLAFTEEFAEAHPNTVKAVLQALAESSAWCDREENHDELAALLATYLDCAPELIRARLGSSTDCGNGKVLSGQRGITFHARNANYPQLKEAIWWLSQLRRWAMLPNPPDYAGIATRVIRPEFYHAAMKQSGVVDSSSGALFDGHPFHPNQPEQYARSFPITHCRA